MNSVLTIILGGGKGTRLYPLTEKRAKPAVPFGGKYRLVDIPISNSINSGFKQIYILTQFRSASLHYHIANTYLFDSFSKGFVALLAAEQTYSSTAWYEGTADAVRKNMDHFVRDYLKYYLILSGDQLYRMNLKDFLASHQESGAQITIAVTPVTREQASGFGILRANSSSKITEFIEKPSQDRDISELKIPASLKREAELPPEKEYLASMGIYIFNTEIMPDLLDNNYTDFGKEIIPDAINKFHVNAYVFNGFWEDIGTIKSFYETNLNLASISPDFNFYDETMPIYTHRRDLPATKINSSTVSEALTADGSIITDSRITRCLVGIRSIIESNTELNGVVCMGADFYETPEERRANVEKQIPHVGIGRGTIVHRAIIDKNARIGEGCRIGVDSMDRSDENHEFYHYREGIVIIPKNAVIPNGTVI